MPSPLHAPPPSAALLGGLAVLVLLGLVAGLRLARARLARGAARARRLGRRGERRALAVLEDAGYRVLAREVTARGHLEVDGRAAAYLVRADALVARRRRRYVAELKGGPRVASVLCRGTRRQLLEYALVFRVDGVLLVDGRRRRIRRVRFPRPTTR